ncbi:MAG: T9SS type A sorting domain-containing protein [Bacteroidota bacterium]
MLITRRLPIAAGLVLFLLSFCTPANAQPCSTCDPANPDFNIILIPEVQSNCDAGVNYCVNFNVFLQNNSGMVLDLVSISLDMAVNTGALPTLTDVESDAAMLPNADVFDPIGGNFVFIFDTWPNPASTNIGGVSYNNIYDYDHIVAGPAFAPQTIFPGHVDHIMTINFDFTGAQTFSDTDELAANWFGQNNYFHIYSGQCVDPQTNIVNSFGFFDAGGNNIIGDCYAAWIQTAPIFLPVELNTFDGKVEDTYNQLEWTTLSESNSEWFVIERSEDPSSEIFEEIGRVAASGNSSTLLSYAYRDTNPLPEGYYRLKMVDLDGTEKLSDVIHLTRDSDFDGVSIYPNPSYGTFSVDYALEHDSEVTIKVLDLLGRTQAEFQFEESRGFVSRQIDLPQLGAGLYFVEVSNGRDAFTSSMVIR